MVFFPSRFDVSITVFLHHPDSNETLSEHAKWEIDKTSTCSFEQILEAALSKTAVTQPPAILLAKHPRKTNETCRVVQEM